MKNITKKLVIPILIGKLLTGCAGSNPVLGETQKTSSYELTQNWIIVTKGVNIEKNGSTTNAEMIYDKNKGTWSYEGYIFKEGKTRNLTKEAAEQIFKQNYKEDKK